MRLLIFVPRISLGRCIIQSEFSGVNLSRFVPQNYLPTFTRQIFQAINSWGIKVEESLGGT